MWDLKYRTRGMSSPKGKPKVYFCCHPEEFDRFFESISKEMLYMENCAVWYSSNPQADRDGEYMEQLKEMQLFVMPVTKKLLTTKNHALEKEFVFAVKNYIPVLPLMQEPGLEAIFNRICGERQFLDKSQSDPTALSYTEKLRKYLDSVLLGDEMAKKVRAAFDAYIFLSYRKKDRKYARELMRLIHNYEFCRDIAIWYDEFLIPGENFNNSIEEALQKSQLFVMTVTPNLVNEENYIMTTEYPMARQKQKKIVPVELVATNKEALKKSYAEIPECTNAYNNEEMKKILQDCVKQLEIQKKPYNPCHNFLIGLAYLNGIDVEVDQTRAVAMITSAANEGYTEAMEKLIVMYREGIGVARNYETAMKWYDILLGQKKRIYEQSGKESDADSYLDTMGELAELLFDLRRVDYAEYIRYQIMDECEKLTIKFLSEKRKEKFAESCVELAKIKYYRDLLNEAHFYYSKALMSRNNQGITLKNRLERARILRDLGKIEKKRGNIAEAQSYYNKCIKKLDEIGVQEECVQADFAEAFFSVADILELQGDYQSAKKYYSTAYVITERLMKQHMDIKLLRLLCDCLERLARMEVRYGSYDEASKSYEVLVDLRDELVDMSGVVEDIIHLLYAYREKGNLEERRGNYAKALELYQKCYGGTKEVTQRIDSLERDKMLAESSINMGRMFLKLEHLKEAVKFLAEATAVYEDLGKQLNTQETKEGMSDAYHTLGEVEIKLGNYENAHMYLMQALAIRLQSERHPENIDGMHALAQTYLQLGVLFRKWEQKSLLKKRTAMKESRAYCQKAYEIWCGLCEKVPNHPEYISCRNMAKKGL